MNLVFAAIVLAAVLTAAVRQIGWVPSEGAAAPMEALSTSMVDSAAGSTSGASARRPARWSWLSGWWGS